MAYTRLACILSLVLHVGCTAPVSFDAERDETTSEAVSATGVTATLSLTAPSQGNFAGATLKVTNNSKTTMSNWQVLVSLGASTWIHTVTGGEVMLMGPSSCTSCLVAFDPGLAGTPLAPGASATVTFGGATLLTTSTYASVASVDGDPSGTPGSTWPNDGVDRIARAAASAASALLVDYENTKLANSSPADANYAVYDGLILSAHMFTLNATYNGIVFDPNAPGYKFISQHTQDLLVAMQSNPEIATYLAVGLQSCFASTNGNDIYTVKATPFKGLTGAGSGGAWLNTPGGTAGTTDQYQISIQPSSQIGADLITLNLKNSSGDYSFGTAYITSGSIASTADYAKFGSVPVYSAPGAQSAACTPFNGPGGGTANPYFVIKLGTNGVVATTVPALLQARPTQCNNPCTASLVVDPLAYQTPPAPGSSQGSTSNPFAYDQTSNWALGVYLGAWASYINSSGTTVLGTFSVAQTVTNPKTKVTTPTGNYLWTACSGKPAPGC